MSIRTDPNVSLPATLGAGDLISKVAVLQHQAARQVEQREREEREHEQRLRVDLLEDSAASARKAAVMGLISGIVRGAATVASACFQAKAAACDAPRASPIAERWRAVGKATEGLSNVDWAGYCQRRLEAEKQDRELDAELAGNRAQERGDAAGEASRQAEAAASQLEKACESRHRAAMAAQRC